MDRCSGQEHALLDADTARKDWEAIQASLNGDASAYTEIVQRYEQIIAAQMWRFTRDCNALNELVQDVFVEAYTSLHTFKGQAPFEHWLRRIATRVGYRHWKHRNRDRERITQLKQETITDHAAHAREPSEAAEYLYTLLERLPPAERLVLTLHYFEELDTEEIGRRMGWTRSLVKVRAFRARKKLKSLLEEAGYGKETS
jgi:RNA polymerase sigma-70 factor (ECF subfamily)